MDYLVGKARYLKERLFGAPTPAPKRDLTKYEVYRGLCYKLLSWEDFSLTFCVFFTTNCLFWLAYYYEIRLLGALFLAILVAFVTDHCLGDLKGMVGVEERHVEGFENAWDDLANFIFQVQVVRKEKPKLFCIVVGMFLFICGRMARDLPHYCIFHAIIFETFFILPLVPLFQRKLLAQLKPTINSLLYGKDIPSEEELIPFAANPDTDLEIPSDKTPESVASSLISGLPAMPSHLDLDDRESLEEDDLLPSSTPGAISISAGDLSSDSDSEKAVRFDSAHFNLRESSSEDDIYPKDFSLPSIDQIDNNEGGDSNSSSGAALNVAATSMATALFNKFLASTTPTNNDTENKKAKSQRKDSSSGSEFEVIDPDDLEEQ